jgi:hypothetical protein
MMHTHCIHAVSEMLYAILKPTADELSDEDGNTTTEEDVSDVVLPLEVVGLARGFICSSFVDFENYAMDIG